MLPLTDRSQLMGSVLVNPSGSRSPMLRRDAESCLGSTGRALKSAASREKDKFTTFPPPHPSSALSSSPSPPPPSSAAASVPLNSEMLRELKRRVLVCLDNNAAAAEVARRLLSDRNADFTKLNPLSRRSCPDSSTVRRKSAGETPFEIVSECFEILDRLLSDIARKDVEIARLQKELASAERLCRSYESRMSHLQESCSRINGSRSVSVGNSATDSATTATTASWRFGETTQSTTNEATGSGVSRSPRKSRRSSVDMLSLPSIHDSGAEAAAAAEGLEIGRAHV